MLGFIGVRASLRSVNIQTALRASRSISLVPDLSKLKLKEQPPGYIIGTVNDAYTPPDMDQYHGSFHWSYDRVIATAMVPLTLAPFVAGVDIPLVDTLLSSLILFHSRAGFQSCITDYIPKRVYGVWHKVAMGLLNLGSWVSIYGIYLLETEGNGLFNLVNQIWIS
ncbi:unnamed protein product [Kuraishia capsulata CBS 1993]|uniref:Succinate dehydrogenase [ubiquinone] cytochrome b small subunit n=1 Tax=Kuraishia capsulata CBS 1993 TaxID=1382522 RepID=W6MIN5_9ASCO|nr:uncharacterized protein KUCA_T00002321001 [Kuraishia capsulata CBS 1993]CDK26349.1 unnamed protein product [Kuraishia capsulata CBS 1993]